MVHSWQNMSIEPYALEFNSTKVKMILFLNKFFLINDNNIKDFYIHNTYDIRNNIKNSDSKSRHNISTNERNMTSLINPEGFADKCGFSVTVRSENTPSRTIQNILSDFRRAKSP